MPNRKYVTLNGYRFGFNGKENDNEVKGEGNQQDYGMRIYDQRLGKFLSVDPLSGQYSFYTPYQFAGNTPIWAIDVDGLEPAETSTADNPKILEGAIVTTSKKSQKALDFVSDNAPVFDYKWGGNITTGTFMDQLRDRIAHPYSMDQGGESGSGGGTNFCWIAAACSYQYQRNPEGMASTMLNLYSKGKANVGNIELRAVESVRKAVGSNTFNNDNAGGLANQYVDQLLFLTIAESYKGYINLFNSSYDLGDENTLWASGTFSKFEGLMKAFGSNVITSRGTDIGTSNIFSDNANVLMNAQKAGQTIFLFVYSAHFKQPPPDGVIAPSPTGTHFVQVRNIKQDGNTFTMDYWDYGKWKTGHRISLEGLNRSTFGILTTKD